MGSQIILLNGPSSSGKSTLSKTLQALIWEKMSLHYEVVSIDDFMKTDPMETIYEDDVFEISGDLCDHVLERMKESSGVIIDHVITSERIYQQLKNAMEGYTLFEMHVDCSLEILKKREEERKDRCPGSAEASATYLFPKDGYDLTVDSGLRSAEENAEIIFEALFKDCV